MRILFLNTRLSGRGAAGEGSSVHFRGVAEYLCRQGHEIWLPVADAPGFAQATGALSLWQIWRARYLDAVYFRIEGRPLRLPGRFPSWLFRLCARLFNWTVIWEINAAPDLVAFDGRQLDHERLDRCDRLLRRQARAVDLAICNTEGLCRYAQDLGIGRAVHVELGTLPAAFTASQHESQRLEVCWLAGNSAVVWHDPVTVVRAAESLRSNAGIHFHLVGDFELDRDLPNVTVHGRVGLERLAEMLQGMDVGLAIYGDGHWSRYGVFSSPLKVFDYMAAGLQVVASPIEQIETLAGKGAYLATCPFGDADALAEVLTNISKDQAFAAGCRRNRQLAQDYYHWDRVGAMTEEAILGR